MSVRFYDGENSRAAVFGGSEDLLVTPRQKTDLQGTEEVVEGYDVAVGTSRRNHAHGLFVGDREHRLHHA